MLGEKKLSIVFQVSGGKLLEGGGIGIEGGIVLHIMTRLFFYSCKIICSLQKSNILCGPLKFDFSRK